MAGNKDVLMVYYDVEAKGKNIQNIYYKIYYGFYVDSMGKRERVPGLKTRSIGALPVNKSVWIAPISSAPMLDKLKANITSFGRVWFDYVETNMDDMAFNKIWNRFKILFVQRMQKLLDETTEEVNKGNLNAKEKALEAVTKEQEHVQSAIMLFGLTDDDSVEQRESIMKSLEKIVQQITNLRSVIGV
jgi:hypothetical protein